MAGSAPVLTVRELAQQMALEGHPLAQDMADTCDAADDVMALAYELDFPRADERSMQDEARRLRTFEQRIISMLEEWGAIDPSDPSPPDPVSVLRMLLG